MDKIYKLYTDYTDVEDFAKVVSIDDIEKKDWNLSPNRYVEYHKEEIRPYAEVLAEFRKAIEDVQKAETEFSQLINATV